MTPPSRRGPSLPDPMTIAPRATAHPTTPRLAQDAAGWAPGNKFLQGPFTPWTEESSAYDLDVDGEIPGDLAGALFRISSNPRFTPRDPDRYHWWEGDGMVCGIYLRDGRAAYRTRWVMTDSMKFEVEQGEAVYSGFANGGSTAPLPHGAPPAKNVANTNVGIFDDHLLVYFEGGLPYSMHPETLETYGTHDFRGGIDVLCTAHYKIDPDSGDMLFFAATGPTITWYRADVKTGHVVDSHSFDIKVPVLMHDFAVSDTYAIFFVTPAQFRLDHIMRGEPGVVWDEASLPHGVQIVLMNRRTHAVSWHEVGGQWANTHFYNAYEEDGHVVIDGHRITRLGTPADRLETPVTSHSWFPPSLPHRWRVDLATGRATEEMVGGVAGEFPRINDAYTGHPHRYGYFVTTRYLANDTMSDGLAKHDHLRDSTTVVEGPDHLTNPGEPVFVARESALAEDDGYLLTLWWNRETGLSELLVHDAADLRRTPLARVKLPSRVPFGFHGNWADQTTLDQAVAARSDAN
ncbi:carotenoid oxygenase family protein [Streptomyces pseudovenezuelae]|uniref:Dioxygenase n=1 Tax=Streptomyces pseudovenezuelae TaxID=67350 RepID=A0ABT6LUQ8_9ACTN|nr:carotenoid oxygenase family protein [Streptomyces pseudovenezuelae]MDH6219559.1 carotenoid cleavage dioxygenase-like enzyme [Streptomyces pseudovenezuelae]